MRILCIFFHPKPSVTALGGAEKRFLETSKIWKKQGVKIMIIEPKPHLSSGIAVFSEMHQRPFFKYHLKKGWIEIYLEWIMWTLYACLKGISAAKSQEPNLVLATNNTVPNLIPAYVISKICRLPLCVIVHHIDILPSYRFTTPLKTYYMYRKIDYSMLTSLIKTLALWLIISILKRSDVCIAVSWSTAKILLQNSISFKSVHVSGNGVNIDYIESFNFKGNKKYDGVFVGRISKEKGIFSLLNVWQQIMQIKPDAKLAIIGSGVELHKIRKTIMDRHLENNVIVLGPCTDKDMYTAIKASKLFIFPSLLEGWGLAVAEALACGLPAVCYDIPAIKEIFGNCKSVFLVPAGDTDKLASTILKVLQMDPNELAKISKTYVRHFDWNEIALRDLQIIRHALNCRA